MRRAVALAIAAALLFGALILPNHPGRMSLPEVARFPLEFPVLILGMVALGGWLWMRWAAPLFVAVILLAAVFVKLTDTAMFAAYNRPFNPSLDLFLIKAGTGLLRDSIGTVGVLLAWIGAVVGLVAVFAALWWALGQWARVIAGRPARLAAGGTAAICAALTLADAGDRLKWWDMPRPLLGSAFTTRLMLDRGATVAATAADLAAFRAVASADPYEDASGLFNMIGDRDVLIIYIESYGRASIDNQLYAPTHIATLRAAEAAIAEAGLSMRSGWLGAPTAGGQSWLAHGALFSGLWTTNQGRYNAMLTAGRRSLFHLAAEAGFRTAAVMPAITIGWPESSLMGFETILEADDMGYDGAGFGWVTMPDQYTLAAFPDLIGDDPRREFIQIALISSHAPWTPVAQMVAWDVAADGPIYNAMAAAGPTPREVWSDHDTVRDHYRQSIDYTLQAAMSFAARQGPSAPLILILGDHPPAGFVSQIGGVDVPAHLIGPADLLARIDGWGWTPGLIPAADVLSHRLDKFRDRFIEAFTTGATTGTKVGATVGAGG
ncbi:MAG TPA: sulfatase-like protein [Roseovarius sp.]